MIVRWKKLDEKAKAPTRATDGAAGYDLTCVKSDFDMQTCQFRYHTGVAVEIPEGYVGLLFPRSSISKTAVRCANSVGVIDSDYRGEISMICDLKEQQSPAYYVGDRIGQLVIVPYMAVEFAEVDSLTETQRGTGGYGSTGK